MSHVNCQPYLLVGVGFEGSICEDKPLSRTFVGSIEFKNGLKVGGNRGGLNCCRDLKAR